MVNGGPVCAGRIKGENPKHENRNTKQIRITKIKNSKQKLIADYADLISRKKHALSEVEGAQKINHGFA
jgi:hypothetical protein